MTCFSNYLWKTDSFLFETSNPSELDSFVKYNKNELLEKCSEKHRQSKHKPQFFIIRSNEYTITLSNC